MEVKHMQHSAPRRPRNVANPANTVYEDSCLHELGGAIYVVERVFTGHRTAKQAVVEEIVASAGMIHSFDRPDRPVV